MLGDAYFQLRAQVGTGLFSLLRLAAEAGAEKDAQAGLLRAQETLREDFTFAALGPDGAGKSTLLNTLFERDFCGAAVEPGTSGRVAVFQYAEAVQDVAQSPGVVNCLRPHIFLRDFTVVEGPGNASPETLVPILSGADVVLYVISAANGLPDIWSFLPRLGRDVLKRLVFVVWQSDRVSSEEGASAVKRLRQAMLKYLGQACPIFIASMADRGGREKLVRWIESEVICSASRRQRLREIEEGARATLGKIVARPRAERDGLDREIERVGRMRAELDECEEQSQRQVAGALWAVAQHFDGLRKRSEQALRERVGPFELLWKQNISPEDFDHEIDIQARATLSAQLHEQLIALESDLRETAAKHLHADGALAAAGNGQAKPPDFPRAALEETLLTLDTPVDSAGMITKEYATAVRLTQFPALAALAAAAVAVGTAVVGRPSVAAAGLAGGAVVFVFVLIQLLRRNLVASFGRHFSANRATLLSALEPALRSAAERFFAGLLPALGTRVEELAAEREQQEPLLTRLQQIEDTFARIETDLRTGLTRTESPKDSGGAGAV